MSFLIGWAKTQNYSCSSWHICFDKSFRCWKIAYMFDLMLMCASNDMIVGIYTDLTRTIRLWNLKFLNKNPNCYIIKKEVIG